MNLFSLPTDWTGMSAFFIEGALLAANANPKPMEPEQWLPVLITGGVEELTTSFPEEAKNALLVHFEQQYRDFQLGQYCLPTQLQYTTEQGITEALSEFAEGFLTVWPYIAPAWDECVMNDGTARMLSALLTTFMLLVDEQGTLQEMEEAHISPLPDPNSLYSQLDVMLTEVIMAADAFQQGEKAQAFNPYKNVGRNDPCVCGSGKKFKQCCGGAEH